MTWLTAFAAAFKPIILPILSAFVAWLIPSPQEILKRKQEAIHKAEEAGRDLDELP